LATGVDAEAPPGQGRAPPGNVCRSTERLLEMRTGQRCQRLVLVPVALIFSCSALPLLQRRRNDGAEGCAPVSSHGRARDPASEMKRPTWLLCLHAGAGPARFLCVRNEPRRRCRAGGVLMVRHCRRGGRTTARSGRRWRCRARENIMLVEVF
jgi:hypothetical protein